MQKHVLISAVIALSWLLPIRLVAQTQMDTLVHLAPMVYVDQMSTAYGADSVTSEALNSNSDLVSALRQSTSLYIRDRGAGNIAYLTMRGGTAQQTSLYWNGMNVNSPSLGLVDISLVPTVFLTGVDIYQGSSSLLTGTGGLGGSLSLHSGLNRNARKSIHVNQRFTPALSAVQTDVSLHCGAKDWRAKTALYRDQADNDFRYMEQVGPMVFEAKRMHAARAMVGVSQDIQFDLTKRSLLSFSGHILSAEREIPSPIGIAPRGEMQGDRIARAMISYKHIGGELVHRLTYGLAVEEQIYRAPQALLYSKINTRLHHIRYNATAALRPGAKLRLRVNNDYSSAQVTASESQSLNRTNGFVGIDFALSPQHLLDLGLSMEQLNSSSSPLIYSIGLLSNVSQSRWFSWRASASRNFRAPTLNDLYWPELGNPDLNPEHGYAAELALKARFQGFSQELLAFASYTYDLLVWLPASDGRYRPVNELQGRAKGLSYVSNVQLGREWSLKLAHTLTRAEVERGVERYWAEQLYQPEQQSQAQLIYHTAKLDANINYDYISSVRTDYVSVVNSRLDDISLLSIGLQHQLTPEIKWGVKLENILNNNYQYVRGMPTPGRFAQFNLRLNIYE